MANLIEGIQAHCNRLREQIPLYEEIGPAGTFGLMMLRNDIAMGEKAIASGDIVEMVAACKYLEDCGSS